jgi:AMP phosphorylase
VCNRKEITAIVNITTRVVPRGHIGVYEEVKNSLELRENEYVEVDAAKFPASLQFLRNKLKGRKLNYDELYEIVKDVVEGNLSEVEIASFVTALNNFGLDMEESANLVLAMVETGEKLKLNNRPFIVDKHSVGGAVGDKTTMLLVPIIAARGLTIPKTSSRAITSACGSADKAEVLMPVNLDIDEMRTVVSKTNGCIVWGGALHLAPADDIFVHIEYPLSIDPLLLPSIMSKKLAVGANYVAIDIPCGRGTKVKTIGDAEMLAKDFIELGSRLGIKTQCAITYGEQPIGYTIGPALEAREALEILMRRRNVPDVVDKATHIADLLMRMVGKDGQNTAMEIIKSGKAEEKLREIIFEQGGNSEIMPEDIEIGKYGFDVHADAPGVVLWINNLALVNVARAAGAPKDKGAGIVLHRKLGDSVKNNDVLFTVYAEKSRKLARVKKVLETDIVFGTGSRMEMLIEEIREVPVTKKAFILER